ncbi:MAG: glycosyltransferase family 2 protein, partial [bacterium]
MVVADNGSTDDSVEFIRKFFPTVQLINIERNLGFCGGYNFALKQVS